MEKHNNSSDSCGVCEKIFGAITARRSSNRQQDPRASSPAPNPSLPIHNHVGTTDVFQTKPVNGSQDLKATDVPIQFDHSTPGKTITTRGHGQGAEEKHYPHKFQAPEKTVTGEGQGQHHVTIVAPQVKQEGKKPAVDRSDTFSDYIKRAKMKIRSVSNVGGGKNDSAAADDANDTKKNDVKENKDDTKDHHFTDFINRAKVKIRTAPSFGSGKTVSFKRK